MDSSSIGLPGASPSGTPNDSLHGLKFGKKIYFEDRSSGGSASKSPPPPTLPPPPGKKGKSVGSASGQQPPRCQVEGCKVDLTGAKAYYCRHKVCGMHSKAPKVVVGGLEQRFCQQCSRFHQLPEFDQGKRSCRRRLAGHNERRRKPHPSPYASRYGRVGASLHDEPSRFRSFLMDFSYPRLTNNGRDVWPTVGAVARVPGNQWQEILEPSSATISTHSYLQGPPAMALYPASEVPPGNSLYPASEVPPGNSIAGVSDSSCALSLLSTQPWSNNSTGNQVPTISASSSFDVTPMTQQAIPNNYVPSSWSFRGHGSRGDPHEMGLVGVTEAGNAHFSGELELALQENSHCLGHDSNRSYDHSGAGMHWSL